MKYKNDYKELLMKYYDEKNIGTRFRQQRAAQWMSNEEIYMGQVAKTNLTRANYNLPHLFDTVHSVSAQLGAGATVSFDTTNDKDENAPEIMKNLWDDDASEYNLEGETDVSKVEAGIYGRAIYRMIPRDNGAHFVCVDTLSFYISPSSKRTKDAHFCGQEFINKTIEQLELEADEMDYDKESISLLKNSARVNPVGQNNTQEESFRKLRMAVLGLNTAEFDKEATIDVTDHYTYWKGTKIQMSVANDTYILRVVDLDDLGLEEFPFYSWATHPRGITFWTTSPADIARDPNLIMSTSLNQQIDNSTYKNFASMFVRGSTGLKQNSIQPRPFGLTPVNIPPEVKIQDSVMMLTPPDIVEANAVIQSIKQFSDSASGVGTPSIPKGQLTATQYASVVAKQAQKNDPMRREYLRCWKEMGDAYANYNSKHLVKPRDVKIYTGVPVTLEGVTFENFQYTDEFGEVKTTKFLAKVVPAETDDENRAIKQKAAIDLYTIFKDDPLVPGQKYLRERVMKEFEITPTEMDKLLSANVGEVNPAMAMIANAGIQKDENGNPVTNPVPNANETTNVVASEAAINANAITPKGQ